MACFTDDERYNISDIFAYLYQYERDIVRNNDIHMLMFCADIALKRLYLFDKFSFCFVSSLIGVWVFSIFGFSEVIL